MDDPLKVLRERLASDRAGGGMTFEQSWEDNVDFVLQRVARRRQWQEVLSSTRHAWEAAWNREGAPGVSMELLDDSRNVYGWR
jgi:hypothetical protein